MIAWIPFFEPTSSLHRLEASCYGHRERACISKSQDGCEALIHIIINNHEWRTDRQLWFAAPFIIERAS